MPTDRIINLLLIFCIFCLAACNSARSSNGPDNCNTRGEVQDFTGLDGCRLLIVTEDGKKLLPGRILDNEFQLEAGQQLNFDYRPIDMMSVCMAEDLIVEITCIEVR